MTIVYAINEINCAEYDEVTVYTHKEVFEDLNQCEEYLTQLVKDTMEKFSSEDDLISKNTKHFPDCGEHKRVGIYTIPKIGNEDCIIEFMIIEFKLIKKSV